MDPASFRPNGSARVKCFEADALCFLLEVVTAFEVRIVEGPCADGAIQERDMVVFVETRLVLMTYSAVKRRALRLSDVKHTQIMALVEVDCSAFASAAVLTDLWLARLRYVDARHITTQDSLWACRAGVSVFYVKDAMWLFCMLANDYCRLPRLRRLSDVRFVVTYDLVALILMATLQTRRWGIGRDIRSSRPAGNTILCSLV